MHNIGWPPYVIHTLIGRTAKRQINQWKTLHRCASWSSSICCYRNGYFKINCPHPYKGWMCGISIVGCLCSIGNSAASHKQPLQHHMTMRSNRTWPSEICFKCVLIHKIRNLYINWKKKMIAHEPSQRVPPPMDQKPVAWVDPFILSQQSTLQNL